MLCDQFYAKINVFFFFFVVVVFFDQEMFGSTFI